MAYDQGVVGLHSRIRYRYNGEIHDTTVGRVLVSDMLPDGMEFPSVNKVLDKKCLSALIDECYRSSRNKKLSTEKLELKKYCAACRTHTLHKEGKV